MISREADGWNPLFGVAPSKPVPTSTLLKNAKGFAKRKPPDLYVERRRVCTSRMPMACGLLAHTSELNLTGFVPKNGKYRVVSFRQLNRKRTINLDRSEATALEHTAGLVLHI